MMQLIIQTIAYANLLNEKTGNLGSGAKAEIRRHTNAKICDPNLFAFLVIIVCLMLASGEVSSAPPVLVGFQCPLHQTSVTFASLLSVS